MRKLVSESLIQTVNEEFSVEIGSNASNFEDNLSKKKEDAAKTFSWSPPSKAVTVNSLNADIIDDYNTDVNIVMSNGDSITYEMFETRTARNGQTAPPYYSFSLKINGKIVTNDLDDVLTGSTGTIVGDILLFYKQTVLEKGKK